MKIQDNQLFNQRKASYEAKQKAFAAVEKQDLDDLRNIQDLDFAKLKDSEGNNLLHIAMSKFISVMKSNDNETDFENSIAIVEFLIDKGVALGEKNNIGQIPLLPECEEYFDDIFNVDPIGDL